MRLARFIVHTSVAVFGGWVISAVGEVVVHRRGTLVLIAFVAGGTLGYLINGKFQDPLACFVWILPVVFFIMMVRGEKQSFSESWAHQTFAAYIWDNYFGTECGGSECLPEFLVGVPLVSALSYSIFSAPAAKFHGDKAAHSGK